MENHEDDDINDKLWDAEDALSAIAKKGAVALVGGVGAAFSGVARVSQHTTHLTGDIKGALSTMKGSFPDHIGKKDDDSAVSGMTSSVMTKEEKKAAKKEKKRLKKEKEKRKQEILAIKLERRKKKEEKEKQHESYVPVPTEDGDPEPGTVSKERLRYIKNDMNRLLGFSDSEDSDEEDREGDSRPQTSASTHEDIITQLMKERAANHEENLLLQRQRAQQEEEEAVLKFQPTADSIDSLILDISLAASKPMHVNKQIKTASKRIAAPAATGLSNYARGSRSSKAGDVNERERRSIVDMGGVQPLAESLDQNNGEFLVTCVADALANLAIDEQGREAVGKSKAILKLVKILSDASHPDADPAQRQSGLAEYAAACLRNLALDEANAMKMAEYGAIPAMIQLSVDSNPVTKGMCACCLACIAKEKR